MTLSKERENRIPHIPMEDLPQTSKDLKPKSFDHLLDEAVACLFPTVRNAMGAALTTPNPIQHGRQLILRALDEYDAGRVEQAWAFLAEALSIGQQYDGFRDTSLFTDRAMIDDRMPRQGKVGSTAKSENLTADNEQLILHMATLPIDPAWANHEYFRATLVNQGELFAIRMEPSRVNGLLKDQRIKAIIAAAAALKK